MSKYKLIEALGLETGTNAWNQRTVLADELERVLEQAPVVQSNSSTPDSDWSGWSAGRNITHTARLLCIQPTKTPDTAESLLRDFVDDATKHYPNAVDLELLARCRRLLEGK